MRKTRGGFGRLLVTSAMPIVVLSLVALTLPIFFHSELNLWNFAVFLIALGLLLVYRGVYAFKYRELWTFTRSGGRIITGERAILHAIAHSAFGILFILFGLFRIILSYG